MEPYSVPPLEIETERGLVPETALAMVQTTAPRLVQQWELVSDLASVPYSDLPLEPVTVLDLVLETERATARQRVPRLEQQKELA